jgi:hypothetical protein
MVVFVKAVITVFLFSLDLIVQFDLGELIDSGLPFSIASLKKNYFYFLSSKTNKIIYLLELLFGFDSSYPVDELLFLPLLFSLSFINLTVLGVLVDIGDDIKSDC